MSRISWKKHLWQEDHIVPDEMINAVENKLGVKFPDDYIMVVKTNQGKTPWQPSSVKVRNGIDVVSTLLHFENYSKEPKYDIYSVIKQHELLSEEQSSKLIPFQKSDGSSVFCFDYRTTEINPPIVFVNSDIEGEEAIIPVANSFTDFLEKPWRLFFDELRKQPTDPNDVDYQVYLTSKLWKKIRRRVLKRDKKTCVFCGGKAQHVHHSSYEREVMEGKADQMLVSMCAVCHYYIHYDDNGSMRTPEETDRILLGKNPPTHIPEPILDLRRKCPFPPEWLRMNDIQQRTWQTRNQTLRKERCVSKLSKKN
jgi:hypothetical protein